MKGTENFLVRYMDGNDKRFIIPVYQRNYDWRQENCKQLFDDLVKVICQNRRSHFFGSIVSAANPDGALSEYLIIDGQQRLTTVSLLLLAMYNLLRSGEIVPEDAKLADKIYETFLVDKWQPEETRMKLKPVKDDRSAYGRLFGVREDYVVESNLTINYDYFVSRILRKEISVDELFRAIRALQIIQIDLGQEDNPQLIFESLNSTGMALSEGDKIRNYILMGLPVQKQEKCYEQYWNKIEKNTAYDVSAFIRDYLSVKQQAIPNRERVYFAFKDYMESQHINIDDLLTDILTYSELYQVLLTGKITHKGISDCILRLNRLETTVARPFFLDVLFCYKSGRLTIDTLAQVFSLTESYVFRRFICDLPTNSLNKIFLTLHQDILKLCADPAQYLDCMAYILLAKKDKSRFPNDDEFTEMFATRPIYQLYAKYKMYILERLENFGTLETKDVIGHIESGDYTIEHIMPQTLTPAWMTELGPEYELVYETWLHRIANLTLTAYNSKYSNYPFKEKRDMKNGFKESGIRLNAYIANQDTWTEVQLEERSVLLKNRALEIWPLASTTFIPVQRILDSVTLEDSESLTGKTLASYTYCGIEHAADSWKTMYEQVVKMLHMEDKSILNKLAASNYSTSGLAAYVTHDMNAFRSIVEIDDGLFLYTNTSTQTKITCLQKLFKLYNADPTDLVFFLKKRGK